TNSDATKSSGRQARNRLTCSIRSSPCETRRSPPRSPPTWTSKNGESICPMGPWPWLSSIASWRERSSSRLKAGRTVHTAPKKGNVQHRKRTDRYTKGPLPQRGHYPTERNHLAGPPAAAKVDQFFAAADNQPSRCLPLAVAPDADGVKQSEQPLL